MAPVALKERHGLLDRLARIHRSISDGAPLPEVLTAVAAGAADLLGDPVAGLRVLSSSDAARTTLMATAGLSAEQAWAVREGFVGQGAGGRAIAEDRVLAVEDHDGVVDDIAAYLEGRRQAALVAPIRVKGRVVGSLTVATPVGGRRYGPLEHELLSALAEHAGLALLDAGIVAEAEPDATVEPDETQLGARLRQAQVLEAAGALAARVADELNHALSVVLGHAAVLGTRELDAGAREDLDNLVHAAEAGAALVHRLGQFGRDDDEDVGEVVDLGAAAASAARQVGRFAPETVELDVRPGARPLPVRIDGARLRQALGLLLDNAVAALEGSGRLVVCADDTALPGEPGALDPGLAAGRYARVTVTDTGRGMAPEVLTRALEPGFTTAPPGAGGGLGLSVAHRIVQRAGGHVHVGSAPGRGTTVTLLLPIAEERPSDAAAPAAPEVVLLVRDPVLLDAARRVLEADGHAVFATRHAEEALATARERSVGVVLADDALPGTSGVELADRFADTAPQAAVVVLSAYVTELADEDTEGVTWLQKPVDATALLAAIRTALARD